MGTDVHHEGHEERGEETVFCDLKYYVVAFALPANLQRVSAASAAFGSVRLGSTQPRKEFGVEAADPPSRRALRRDGGRRG